MAKIFSSSETQSPASARANETDAEPLINTRENKMRIAIIGLIAMLTACVHTSEAVPIGKDTYMIAASSAGGPGASGPDARISAARAANRFCQARGQQMVVSEANASKFGFTGLRSQLTFKCLSANDPEYTKAPD